MPVFPHGKEHSEDRVLSNEGFHTMKTELYHYAMFPNGKKLSDPPKICVWILLSMFLFPILLSIIWIGLVLLALYTFLYLRIRKIKEPYEKALLNWGLFMIFLGIECSLLVIIQCKIIQSLILAIGISLIVYEIAFILKIKLKIYSRKSKASRTWAHIISSSCGGSGIWLGKLLNIFGSTGLKLCIVIFVCSVLIVEAITFFQKYVIYTITKK